MAGRAGKGRGREKFSIAQDNPMTIIELSDWRKLSSHVVFQRADGNWDFIKYETTS